MKETIFDKAIHNFIPPAIPKIFDGTLKKYIANQIDKTLLFDGEDHLFKELMRDCSVYGEYGMGRSTQYALDKSDCMVISVESDQDYSKLFQGVSERIIVKHIELGKLTKFGKPIGYDFYKNFKDYTEGIWREENNPDFVLIDGRFRICCLLTSIKYAKEGTKILFDDYIERPEYHFAENILKPIEKTSRQALFEKLENNKIDEEKLDFFIQKFQFVMN